MLGSRPRTIDEDHGIGRSKGGLSTKIHALVDALGNPPEFILTPGQAHDLEGADALLPDIAAEVLLADKAFDADQRVIEPLLARGKSVRDSAQELPQGSTRFRQRCLQGPPPHREFLLQALSNTVPSSPATTKPPEISSPQSTSRLLSHLAQLRTSS